MNINCLRCNTQNDFGAKFCKNCGIDLKYVPSSENGNSNQTVNQLLLLMGIEYLIYLGWFILQIVIVPIFFEDENWDQAAIYTSYRWITEIISILILLMFAIIVKNKNARLFLIIFLTMKIIFFVGLRIF